MLARLNTHRAWANHVYLDWLAALTTPDDYCLKMLSHVLRAEEAWLTRLRGGTPENRVWDVSSREELEALRVLNDAALETFVNEEPQALARVLRYTRFDGTPMESTVADILSHVCLHGVHHRAQIAAHATRAGLPKPPSRDFIVFAREHP